MSDEDVGAGAGRDVRPPDPHLRLDDLLLLHEEMADAAKDDALNVSCVNLVNPPSKKEKTASDEKKNGATRRTKPAGFSFFRPPKGWVHKYKKEE